MNTRVGGCFRTEKVKNQLIGQYSLIRLRRIAAVSTAKRVIAYFKGCPCYSCKLAQSEQTKLQFVLPISIIRHVKR